MKRIPAKLQALSLIWHILALTALLLTLGWVLLSSLTFFSNDTGLRFLQVRSLIAQQWQTFAVPYPARFLDPDLVHTPYYYAYSLLDNDIYLNITPFLPLFTSFLYGIVGKWALPIIPVLGGVATAVATYRLGVLAQIRYPKLLLWMTVLATPLLFYSLELWDHSLATACAMWSIYGLAQGTITRRWQPILWGGIAAGIGLGQRPEMYVYALASAVGFVLVTWPRWRDWVVYGIGGLIGALPVWVSQYVWVGHPLGMVVAPPLFGYGRPSAYPVQSYSGVTITPAIKIGRLLLYIESRDPWTFLAALLVLSGAFLLIFALRLPRLRKPQIVISSMVLSLVGYSLFLIQARDHLLPGLLTTLPLFGLALAYLDRDADNVQTRPVYHLVLIAALLFMGLMVTVWPAFGGEQWGARYLLPLYPLFLFLAFYAQTRWHLLLPQTMRMVFGGLLIAGLIVQLAGVYRLFVKHTEQIADKAVVTARGTDLILTNSPFLPSFMAALDDKMFLYVDDPQDIIDLVPRMKAHQINQFTIVTVTGLPLTIPTQVGDVEVREISPFVYQLR